MAELALDLEAEMYRGEILGKRFEFPATSSNKYCLLQFLRGFKKASGKQGIFNQAQIAGAIPDFEGSPRQSVDDHERRFRESRRVCIDISRASGKWTRRSWRPFGRRCLPVRYVTRLSWCNPSISGSLVRI